MSSTFLMAKRLSATVSDFNQIERISDRLDRKGICGASISRKSTTPDMEQYNRQGLKAALDAAPAESGVYRRERGQKRYHAL